MRLDSIPPLVVVVAVGCVVGGSAAVVEEVDSSDVDDVVTSERDVEIGGSRLVTALPTMLVKGSRIPPEGLVVLVVPVALSVWVVAGSVVEVFSSKVEVIDVVTVVELLVVGVAVEVVVVVVLLEEVVVVVVVVEELSESFLAKSEIPPRLSFGRM